jgi:hypothetical protein
MNFEDLRAAWQCQKPGAKVTINAEALLREVRLAQRLDKAIYFFGDMFLVGVYAIMIPIFLYAGIRYHAWTFYLMAFACFFVGVFIPVDRWLQRRKQLITTNDSLTSCIKSSLIQVTHAIWRSKNIFWWYVLPLEIGFAATAASWVWRIRDEGWANALTAATYALFCGLIGWFTYWLNQYTVRRTLEPRRKELEELLASLNEDVSNAGQPPQAQ